MVRKKGKSSKSKFRGDSYDPDGGDEISYDYDDMGSDITYEQDDPWPTYHHVEDTKNLAEKRVAKLIAQGERLEPVMSRHKKIATTFWGQMWCKHIERFQDYASRLPKARSYLRNGSVIDLQIKAGEISARVSGQELYSVGIRISSLSSDKKDALIQACAGQVGSTVELLAGHISDEVMTIVTDEEKGLFPLPDEIKLDCNCPDWADVCKHIAATLYGVAVRLDEKPELLFVLRDVHPEELTTRVSSEFSDQIDLASLEFDTDELGRIFGIEIAEDGE